MLIALLLALQAAPPPTSMPPGPPAQPPATIVAEPVALFVATCDADGDARVTPAELTPCVQRSFAGAEGAGGGSIGYIAFADWSLRWLGDRNALPSPFEVDRDGDNRITLPELQARLAQAFARFDVNRDAVLTRAELVSIRARAPGGDGGREAGRRPGRR